MAADNTDLGNVLRIARELNNVTRMDSYARGALIGLLLRSVARLRANDPASEHEVATMTDIVSPS